MGKPIIGQLKETAASQGVKEVVRNLPPWMVYGDTAHEAGNVGDMLGYMLKGNVDEYNQAPYIPAELQFANKWAGLYERSKTDTNVAVGLFAYGADGNIIMVSGENGGQAKPMVLGLERKIADYINNTPTSILKTKTMKVNDQEEKYQSIELAIEDLSTGGMRM